MLNIYADWAPTTLDMKKMEKYDKEEEMEEEDMLDIYADWAPATLDDQRIEKKRSKRGRGAAPGRRTLVGQQSSSQNMVRRPGTPTVAVKKVKGWDTDNGLDRRVEDPKERSEVFPSLE